MFNFKDISHSLYDLYVNHLGNQKYDSQVASRMILIKKSKSALIMPLIIPVLDDCPVDESPQKLLVGSLELYRFHNQQFDEDMEQRLQIFSSLFARDVLPLYFQMRNTQHQVSVFPVLTCLSDRATQKDGLKKRQVTLLAILIASIGVLQRSDSAERGLNFANYNRAADKDSILLSI